MRILKWTLWSLAGLIALLLLAVAVIAWVVDPNAFKPRIEAAVRDATGRDFALPGDIDLEFFPWLALSTGKGQFGNPPGFPAEPMASWERAAIGVRLLPLLRGELEVDRITLIGADVRLLRRADGSANWEGIGGDEPAGPDAPQRDIRIGGLLIDESRLLYVDEAAGSRAEVAGLRISTDEIAPEKPLTDTSIEGVLRMQGFAPEGVRFRFASPRIALTEEFSRLEVAEFELHVGELQAAGRVAGSIGGPVDLAGELTTNTFDLRALLTSVGVEAPATTDPAALTRLQLSTAWKVGAGMRVDPLTVLLDDTRFSGRFQQGEGEDAVGEFELHGDRLDIARYLPPTDPESEPFVLPTAALRALKFRGVFELEQATLDDIEMKGVTLRLLLDEQGLRAPPAELASR